MPNYRRCYVPGGTYFFTVVTQDRLPIFRSERNRQYLRDSFTSIQEKKPFELFAIVLLPDHLHCVWTLPPGDDQYSIRWAQIKESFTRHFLCSGEIERRVSRSRLKHRERGVWQRRFWEHTIEDGDELIRCVDYIHWNPVKHGYVKRVRDYPWSSFHRFVQSGDYDLDWGNGEVIDIAGAEWE